MKQCKGCGAILQDERKNEPGYTPNLERDYCQRCFRLIHYDDLMFSMRQGVDKDDVLKRIGETEGLIVWTVDLFDFEASLIPGINRHLDGRDIVVVGTKLDLFPLSIDPEKIGQFVLNRFKEENIHIRYLILTSSYDEEGIEEFKECIEQYQSQDIIVMGRANSGKSTFLNRLAKDDILTSSRYPGTTLDFNEVIIDERKYIDTPGIEVENSILMQVKEEDLKTILPQETLKPRVYQIYQDQTFILSGLVNIDLYDCKDASIVFYLGRGVHIHRTKTENRDSLWQEHYGTLFQPIPLHDKTREYKIHKDEEKLDIVIHGLGWACVSGHVKNISIKVPEGVDVTFRKAMI